MVRVGSDDRRVDAVDGVFATQVRSCVVVDRTDRVARWVGDGCGPARCFARWIFEDEPEEPVPFDLDAVDRRLAALDGDQ